MGKRKKTATSRDLNPSPSPKALLIEDDSDYAAAIGACLEAAGCEAEIVTSVKRGLARLEQALFDIVVWGVPSAEDGRTENVEQLRAAAKCPLIVVDESIGEARASFESGADQFLPKPFVPGALVGAVKSALRTQGPSSAVTIASSLVIAGTTFDAEQRRITTPSGRHVALTHREWDLFAFMLGHSNRYFTAADLIREAWGATNIAEEQLRTYVARIRRKTKDLDLPCQVDSRQGLGYRLVLEEPHVPSTEPD